MKIDPLFKLTLTAEEFQILADSLSVVGDMAEDTDDDGTGLLAYNLAQKMAGRYGSFDSTFTLAELRVAHDAVGLGVEHFRDADRARLPLIVAMYHLLRTACLANTG
jgi:hypothetical protein